MAQPVLEGSPITLRIPSGTLLTIFSALVGWGVLGIGGNSAKNELVEQLKDVKSEIKASRDEQKRLAEELIKLGSRLATIEAETLDARLRQQEQVGAERRLTTLERDLQEVKAKVK